MELPSRSEKTKARKGESENAIRIPKVLDTKVKPLFSLPPDLMSPKRCKRKGEKIKREEKMQKFRGAPHTAKRLREEKFRRYKKQKGNSKLVFPSNSEFTRWSKSVIKASSQIKVKILSMSAEKVVINLHELNIFI